MNIAAAGEEPRLVIIPTIDVEGSHGERPFEQQVLGEVGEEQPWGVHKIAEILSAQGASGTFFVDLYEHTMWGKPAWRSVCERLVEAGQDVQLHTHPGWRTNDKRDKHFPQLVELKRTKSFLSSDRYLMAHLSLEEQIQMLEHGCELLDEWTGERPMAHRSGEYSVNDDTILALQHVGIPVDSSQNRASVQSKIDWTFNALARRNDVLEIPVTVFDRTLARALPDMRGTVRRSKTDLAYGARNLVRFCEDALRLGLPVMNLFMHSSSLLKENKYSTRIVARPSAARDLQVILQWGRAHASVEIMSIKQYYESGIWRGALTEDAPDAVPRVACAGQLIAGGIRSAWRSLK